MENEIQKILSLLASTFEKNPWYGPSLKEVLSDIKPEQAFKKLEGTHTIIEIVAHMTAWRTFVIRKLEGDEHYSVEGHMNFPSVSDWSKVQQDLFESQAKLISALQNFPGTRLSEVVSHDSYRYTYYALLHGIIHHDVYHTGQISLIKKAS
jgi:uncharacterized damage-inducible protein DinB